MAILITGPGRQKKNCAAAVVKIGPVAYFLDCQSSVVFVGLSSNSFVHLLLSIFVRFLIMRTFSFRCLYLITIQLSCNKIQIKDTQVLFIGESLLL